MMNNKLKALSLIHRSSFRIHRSAFIVPHFLYPHPVHRF